MAGQIEFREIGTKFSPWRFSVAPMMEWTDRHYRVLARLHSRNVRLYTEMVTSAAILHGDRERLLGYDAVEHPLAVQLGGSDARELAQAAKICAAFGYDEINLNVGCPSDRVQNGAFGACLMRDPALVAACVAAMKDASDLPVTVKCRIGVDDQEPRPALFAMARAVVGAGADALIVHARKAWLKGLSPKENRDIPPLDYPLVHELKRALPEVAIAINGGVATLADAAGQLESVDGVMIGRAAYHDLSMLQEVDPVLFGVPAPFASGRLAVEAFLPYIENKLSEGARLADITRHMLGLFAGRPGARAFRRHLATHAVRRGADGQVVADALALVDHSFAPRASERLSA
ncbi:tRNA dihydrouridine(20/20a) synthase DusA [Rhodoblastus acidophilus]|uniref:tRNA-dihydrouridine(20/20a) synthase n=1 Tax=Candidatus Rhodoblastus alkanivorans TaxID=2954117 RepID=A0ABS9Z9L5_9HYPH|nr:tRNA dihydrouridine(20/20a) synthase DusA [Candidatus Rhodoblastus alkanivorans]MCI4680817.1 tRNA dihydrouridine(20/20a) synthase DusA [Candidatus Rhodoblastus alkanivorans]MCI4684384.1 tRNA dihydrouridine(20/20a) synthase DusA [Candidatus Rhodoblastus alkanivorans]MDI4641705.1 tRNA dihydrouridine(20/20a) synthase DusA [Rhodoblastus acidophilus]